MKLEIKLHAPPNRQRYKSVPHSDYVASVLAKHYNGLKQEFDTGDAGNFHSMSYSDIFHEAILYVIQDKKAFEMSEDELIEHFKYRYNMIKFQIIQDSKLKFNTNADNLQAKEETE